MLTTRDGKRCADPSIRTHRPRRRALTIVATLAVASTVVLTAGVGSASAAVGDSAAASARYLSGSLFSGTLAPVIDLAGQSATNDGTVPTLTQTDNLDLTALGALHVTSVGGVQVPLGIVDAGVLSQFAQAGQHGSSIAAAGLVAADGTIGTSAVAPADVPGPLSFDLGDAVASAGLSTAMTDELGDLSIQVGAASSRAAASSPTDITRDYQIAGARLTFTSAALGDLVGNIQAAIVPLQSTVDGLQGTLELGLAPAASLAVTTPDLGSAVNGLLAGSIGSLAADGVSVNLSSGTVTVDIDHFAPLNGLGPNTDLLTPSEVAGIVGAITALVNSVVSSVGSALQDVVDGISIEGSALLGAVTIDTTVGRILTGTTQPADLSIFGGAITLGDLLGTLQDAVSPIGGISSSLLDDVATPVIDAVSVAVGPVLAAVIKVTVNAQATGGGVASVTALRLQLLPALPTTVTADLATSSVGPNVIAAPAGTPIDPGTPTDPGGSSGSGGSHGAGGSLATTGFDPASDLSIAVLLMLVGGVALALRVRRVRH